MLLARGGRNKDGLFHVYLAAENDVCVVIYVYIHTMKLKIYHGDTFSLSEDFASH